MPVVRNGDCGSGYFCSCDGGCMELPTLCSWRAIIAPEETPASHPLPSCVPAPVPVCWRLSVSTTSRNVPALILAGGLESSPATASTPLLDLLILDTTGLASHRSCSRLILTTKSLKKKKKVLDLYALSYPES